jgi:hypothetical protein
MNNEIVNPGSLKISRISVISVISLIVGMCVYFLNFIISASGYITKSKEPLLMVLPLTLWMIAFVLGLVDIFKKERRKILSIIIVVISGIPLALFLLILVIMLVFGP